MSQQMGDVTSDDRLWAALAYVFSPLVPVLIFVMEDKKNRPYIRSHNAQALVLGIALLVLMPIIAAVTFGLGSLLWLLMLWFAYQAYQGKAVNIPVITDFVQKQGWA